MPRVTTSDEVFKKTKQVVGRPPVTSDNINDQYMRNPPQNHSESHALNTRKEYYAPGPSQAEIISDEAIRVRMLGDNTVDEPLGRTKKIDAVATLVQENSLHR